MSIDYFKLLFAYKIIYCSTMKVLLSITHSNFIGIYKLKIVNETLFQRELVRND